MEQIPGVRFAEMFTLVSKKANDGDAAIQIVWRLVREANARMNAPDER